MRRMVAAAVAALLLPGLVGCGGDDAPEASPAPKTSSSTTAASAPTLPAEARGSGPKAAEAFVRHYVDLINHGLDSLNGTPLKAASTSDCQACLYFIEAFDTTKQRAGRYEGGEWTIARLERMPRTADGDFNIRAWLDIAGGRVIQEGPRDVATFSPQQTAYNFIVVQNPSGLAVKRIAGVSQ